MDTAQCKELIVDFCKKNPDHIRKQFVDEEVDIISCQSVSNWKRMSKEKDEGGNVVRGFDCKPYDDQLRAYVTTKDDVVIELVVQGE
jgi:hypothetical protein